MSVTADEVMTTRFTDGVHSAAQRTELVMARAGSTMSLWYSLVLFCQSKIFGCLIIIIPQQLKEKQGAVCQ